MTFDYLVIVISLKLASVAQKCFGFFFVEKKTVLANYQRHPLNHGVRGKHGKRNAARFLDDFFRF